MAIGLVLVSAFLALVSAGVSLVIGGTWLGAIAVYFAVGMMASLALVGRLILVELRSGDGPQPLAAPIPARDSASPA